MAKGRGAKLRALLLPWRIISGAYCPGNPPFYFVTPTALYIVPGINTAAPRCRYSTGGRRWQDGGSLAGLWTENCDT